MMEKGCHTRPLSATSKTINISRLEKFENNQQKYENSKNYLDDWNLTQNLILDIQCNCTTLPEAHPTQFTARFNGFRNIFECRMGYPEKRKIFQKNCLTKIVFFCVLAHIEIQKGGTYLHSLLKK